MTVLRRAPRRYRSWTRGAHACARWLGTHLLRGAALTRRRLAKRLRLCQLDVPISGLPPALDGLRVVQLSDLHAGPWLDEAALEPVRQLVLALKPDLLVITGDFITDGIDDVLLCGAFFSRLPARLGAFAVLGNHDCRGRQEARLAAHLRRQGVRLLRDESVLLPCQGARLRLVGLADLEESGGADLNRALAQAADDDDARILLCHHPAVQDLLPADAGIDLVLSGHTHGGQLRWPWATPRADGGRCQAGTRQLGSGCWAHVNRGLGSLLLPLRWGAPAEVSCLTLRASPAV